MTTENSTQDSSPQLQTGLSGSIYGLITALTWALSPIFIKKGLEDLDSPILGVTIGMVVSTVAYGILILLRRNHISKEPITLELWLNQSIAGVLTGFGTLFRWIALDLAHIAVVVTLGRFNMVVVIVISAFMTGKYAEKMTWKVWLGAALVIAGAVILGLDND
ncbi:MAG: hypothetical protein A2Z14_13530 [Chloroflexi bacterium RBG_16_48_8]|nr:MAG: hypothetical protein A2Z14_13530 [Chloroflexi bacterium RBG_16_48_8]